MPDEVNEKYNLENGLPDYQATPEAIKEFFQKYGKYPGRVIVHPKNMVEWKEYFIPISTQIVPSTVPLTNKDIDAQPAQGYYIPIIYDKEVDEKTLMCSGFAIL